MRCKKCGNTGALVHRAECDDFVLVSLDGRMTEDAPQWVYDDHRDDLDDPRPEALPIGCPACRTWGEENFEETWAPHGKF